MLRAIHVHQVFWGLYQGPQLLQPPKKAVEFYGSVFAVRAQGFGLGNLESEMGTGVMYICI